MDTLIEIYNILNTKIETPVSYGIFHLASIAILLAATLIACLLFRRSSNKTIERLLTLIWSALVILEVYKQVIFGLSVENGKLVWDYAWYAFPFQFCSSPLYILPLLVLTKCDMIKDTFISYMITFSFFGGLVVMIYPNDVYISTLGIDIQTMIHHGAQVLIGALLAVRYRHKMNLKFFLKGLTVFVFMCLAALMLNYGFHHLMTLNGVTDTFNMFYISPFFDCTLPLLSTVYANTAYPVFLAIYIFGFIICGIVMYLLLKGISYPLRNRDED